MVVLRTEISGMWMFYNLFIRLVDIWLLCYNVGNWILWVSMRCALLRITSCNFVVLKIMDGYFVMYVIVVQ